MQNAVYLPLDKSWLARGQEPVAASRIGNMVFTSGVPGIDLSTGALGQGAEKQFELAFVNLIALLKMAGAGPESIGLLTVFIPDRANRAYINKDWLKLFPGGNTGRRARQTRHRCRRAWKCN
jgi:2-iminobutanoate/2-iminopropanoate deaminase